MKENNFPQKSKETIKAPWEWVPTLYEMVREGIAIGKKRSGIQ